MRLFSKTLITLCLIFIGQNIFANNIGEGEGMWLPQLLGDLNEAEMKSMGMKMTAEDIYSINKGSLKDAIVHFGGFCTGEIISDQGLLLTNHHCGYGQIQSHSTVDNNLLKNGFWAKTKADELSNPGLFAKFIVRIDDVTKQVLAGVTDDMDTKARQSLIDQNTAAIKNNATVKEFEELIIKPFFKGNQYYSILTVTYNDVRLVGTPPESIGKFGADTDNWVWPRHTGDFALFRVYAGKDNMPAEYSADNVPLKPKHFLPVSLDGVEQDDFTLVFGFPGRTNQYLPSPAVAQTMNTLNPAKIAIRDKALKILDAEMRKDEATRLKYASKFAGTANYWKKWIGENQGLKATDGLGRKHRFEKDFQQRVSKSKKYKKKYGDILPQFEKLYTELEPYALTRDYYNEVFGRNIEVMRVAGFANRLAGLYDMQGDAAYNGFKSRLVPFLQGFYKNYSAGIDQDVFIALMEMYLESDIIAGAKAGIGKEAKMKGGVAVMAQNLFEQSFLHNGEELFTILDKEPAKAVKMLQSDPLVKLSKQLSDAYGEHVSPNLESLQTQISDLQRVYMKAQMEMFPEKKFFPDANSTMRVTYGQVSGYQPKDAVTYTPVTYLDGVIQKYVPGDYEFDVEPKLLELYHNKDYGQYADKNGKVPVCFIGSNHTTGGNSGSPAIDAHGNLIGLNFDRVWEGTMSDINYDASICRNIMVDARYILFIVDKFAGATHLIDEMKLVHPKGRK